MRHRARIVLTTKMMPTCESPRQIVHMGVVVLAFLLRFLSAPWAFFVAFALLVHNVLLLPRYAPSLFRPEERGLGGVFFYPLALCALVLLFPGRLEVVAGAWALLGVGDGLATLVGRSRPIAALPWNSQKSIGGLLAFVVGGTLACSILVVWTSPEAGRSAWILFMCGVCALIAGLVESLLLPINDNLLIPLVAAPCLAFLLAVDVHASTWTWPGGILLFAVFVNILLAAVAYRLGLVSLNGGSWCAVIGTLMYLFGGAAAYLLMVVFLVLVFVVPWSRLGAKPADQAGQENFGRPSGKDVLAHCGLALLLVFLLAVTDGIDPLLRLMYVAALASALADRVGRRLAPVASRLPFKAPRIQAVPLLKGPGISAEASLLGICVAAVFAVCGGIVGLCSAHLVLVVIVGATLGDWVKCVMVSTAADRDVTLDARWLAFLNTFAGALSAAIVAYLVAGGELSS